MEMSSQPPNLADAVRGFSTFMENNKSLTKPFAWPPTKLLMEPLTKPLAKSPTKHGRCNGRIQGKY